MAKIHSCGAILANRAIFGAGRLHRLPWAHIRQRALGEAYSLGFRTFDAAPSYGNGVCETEVGIALRGKRSGCEINTKYGIPITIYGASARHLFPFRRLSDMLTRDSASAYLKRDFSARELESSLHGSLLRLGTDYIDTLFLHEPLMPLDARQLETIAICGERMKKQGKIRALGVAGPLESIRQCISIAPFDVVQIPFAEFDDALPMLEGKKVVLFWTYQAYRRSMSNLSFSEFVKGALAARPDVKVIVSSKSLETIQTFGSLLA